jgi:hypothetical protein
MISTLQAVEEASDPWSTAKGILTDHEVALCDHTEGAATLWSMLADLTKRRLAYSLGAPCRNQYKETPWPGKS